MKDSPIPNAWYLQHHGWGFQRCPLKLVTRTSLEYLRAYSFFEKGYLPNAGGWLEQPAKFIEVIGVIKKEVDIIQDPKINKGKK